MKVNADIIIVGSGIVGATAALALANDPSLKIVILDSSPLPSYQFQEQYAYRVSALSPTSKNILRNLGVWEGIEKKRASPYKKMQVWDAAGAGKIHFDCETIPEPALGYIVEDTVTRSSLLEKLSQYAHIQFFCPIKLISYQHQEEYIELVSEDEHFFRAPLVIAADGANSWVRTQAGISLHQHDYQHTAIVTTVKTELSHQTTAWQRFLPTGPLAFLPLVDPHYCSIVWSTSPETADQLLKQTDLEFCESLAQAFDYQLGNIISAQSRHAFPLIRRHAKNYVLARLALIGDAAHTLHPLAGQGVNLGLLDAASLAEIILIARQKNRDFSSLGTLRRYERWRKSDTVTMLAMIDSLKYLFSHQAEWITTLRNVGLTIADKGLFIKDFLGRYASGKRDDLPKLGY